MHNPVNERLGRKRGNYTERAHKKLVQKMCEQLDKETGRKTKTRRQLEDSVTVEELRS